MPLPKPSKRSGLPLTPAIGWGLVAVAFAVGYALYGWAGVLLAFTISVFWLLLQFSRMMRTMRHAASRPIGAVHSAVMMSTRIPAGMKMIEVLALTGSIGLRLPHPSPGAEETWEWRDNGGDALVVDFAKGRTLACTLVRAQAAPGSTQAIDTASAEGPSGHAGPGNRIEG